jgi:aspartate/methionine/tyrosine aminotransferase
VDGSWTDSVRAVLAVSPNNPTGSTLTRDELGELAGRCGQRDAALIVDEVFADYLFAAEPVPAVADSCLLFRLGGLSKSAGLPQVKLGWIGIEGPVALRKQALDRLELICDTYLSVSTPVQAAAASLLENGARVRQLIKARLQRNYTRLRELASHTPSVEVLHADGGWSAVMRVPATRSEEDMVLELLEQDGVLVHPGFFFDFAHEAFLVVSLLAPPDAFDLGVQRLLARADV